MEKLIPLLNERHNLEWVLWSSREGWDYLFVKWDKENKFFEERIISKWFWFIKRLVENDKINLWKIKKLYRKSNEHSIHTYPIMYEYSDLECLIMLLSISDTPIDDLISYLK